SDRDWSSDVCSSDLLITRVPKSEIHNPKSCLPEAGQSQLETWQHRIACYRFRMLQTLRRVTRPIHIHPVINGIDEPAEPSAVGRSEERRVGKECRWG